MSSKLQWMLPLFTFAALGSIVEPGITQTTETGTVLLQEAGRLEEGDIMLEDGSLVDVYEISGQAGQTISITLESVEFDPYLLIQTAEGEIFEGNDDIAENSWQSYVSVTLPETGAYQIVTNAFANWQRGSYLLTVVDGKQPPIFSNAALEQTEANQLNILGIEQIKLGQYRKSVTTLETALEIYQRLGDSIGEGRAYGNLGIAYRNLGNYQQAISLHEKDLAIAIELGDRNGAGFAYGSLGLVYQNLGNYQRAIDFHEQRLAIALESGDRGAEGRAYGNLGIVYNSRGDYSQAINFHEQRLAIALELRDRSGEGEAYANLGIAYQKLADYQQAIDFYEKHLAITRELKDRNGEGQAYGNLGITYYKLEDYYQALDFHEKQLAIVLETGEQCEVNLHLIRVSRKRTSL